MSAYQSNQSNIHEKQEHKREIFSEKPSINVDDQSYKLDKEMNEEPRLAGTTVTLPEITRPKIEINKLKTIDSLDQVE